MYTLKSYNPKNFTMSKRGKIANFIHFFVDKVFNVNFVAIFSAVFKLLWALFFNFEVKRAPKD